MLASPRAIAQRIVGESVGDRADRRGRRPASPAGRPEPAGDAADQEEGLVGDRGAPHVDYPSPMRVLVTGGAGFIGSHFVKRLVAGGDDVVVLDKLTYAGNPANLEGTGAELVVGDIADADAVAARRGGLRRGRQLRRRDARRPLDPRPAASSSTRTCSARRRCSSGRARNGARYVQVSTDEVYGDLEAGGRARRGRSAPARRAPTAPRRRAATCRCSPTCARTASRASITRGANTYGPNQYPEKLIPLFVTNALDGEPLPVYGDGKQVREWLHAEDHCAGVELVLREGAPGEVYNIGGEDHENLEVTHRILELTGADPSLIRHVEDRAGHDRRYALDDGEAACARLGAAALVRRGRVCPRRSSGTRRTAPGGSRSSPASTATTTRSSTPSGFGPSRSRSIDSSCAGPSHLLRCSS